MRTLLLGKYIVLPYFIVSVLYAYSVLYWMKTVSHFLLKMDPPVEPWNDTWNR